MSVVVERPAALTLLQDAGRPGRGDLGVSASGAFDRGAMRQANLLLGNQPSAAVLEVLGGGLVLLAVQDTVVAVTGAVGPTRIDRRPMAYGRAVPLLAGRRLEVGPPVAGLRTYIGVGGGFVAAPELDSVSTDTLAGLGPAPLAAGDRLGLGAQGRRPDLADVLPLVGAGELTLEVVLGPRDDWFTSESVRRLLESPWQVSPASNRVGVRLAGPTLQRSRTEELPSEPCIRGSVQVAADGLPIVFGPDHPVTGGYPVIAVVLDRHTDRLAQAAPGQVVRFRRVSRP